VVIYVVIPEEGVNCKALGIGALVQVEFSIAKYIFSLPCILFNSWLNQFRRLFVPRKLAGKGRNQECGE
jgi:hypothetical protein